MDPQSVSTARDISVADSGIFARRHRSRTERGRFLHRSHRRRHLYGIARTSVGAPDVGEKSPAERSRVLRAAVGRIHDKWQRWEANKSPGNHGTHRDVPATPPLNAGSASPWAGKCCVRCALLSRGTAGLLLWHGCDQLHVLYNLDALFPVYLVFIILVESLCWAFTQAIGCISNSIHIASCVKAPHCRVFSNRLSSNNYHHCIWQFCD